MRPRTEEAARMLLTAPGLDLVHPHVDDEIAWDAVVEVYPMLSAGERVMVDQAAAIVGAPGFRQPKPDDLMAVDAPNRRLIIEALKIALAVTP